MIHIRMNQSSYAHQITCIRCLLCFKLIVQVIHKKILYPILLQAMLPVQVDKLSPQALHVGQTQVGHGQLNACIKLRHGKLAAFAWMISLPFEYPRHDV